MQNHFQAVDLLLPHIWQIYLIVYMSLNYLIRNPRPSRYQAMKDYVQ